MLATVLLIIVLAFLAYAIISQTALGVDVQNLLTIVGLHAQLAWYSLVRQYNLRIRPHLLGIGRAIIGVLIVVGLSILYHLIWGQAKFWWSMALLALDIGLIVWILSIFRRSALLYLDYRFWSTYYRRGKRVRRRVVRRFQNQNPASVIRLYAASAIALFVMGMGLIVGGAYTYYGPYTILGAILALSGMYFGYLFIAFLGLIGVKTIDLGEGLGKSGSNVLQAFIVAIQKGDIAAFARYSSGPNFANQENIIPAIKYAFTSFAVVLAPILVGSVLFSHPLVLLLAPVASIVTALVWITLEHAEISTIGRRQRSAILFEILSYAGLAYFFYRHIKPELPEEWRKLLDLEIGIGKAVAAAFLSVYNHAFVAMASLVAVATLVILLLHSIRKWGPEGKFFRFLIAFPLAVILVAVMWSIAGVVGYGPVAQVWNRIKLEHFTEFKPDLKALPKGRDGKPEIVVSWMDIPGAQGYKVLWRRDDETEFRPITEGGKDLVFQPGVTEFVDRDLVERGDRLYYRIVALKVRPSGPDVPTDPSAVKATPVLPGRKTFMGEDLYSDEHKVIVPLLLAKEEKKGTGKGPGVGPRVSPPVEECVGEACRPSPSLGRLRQRFPRRDN